MKTAIDNVESACYTILALGYRVSESTITVAVASLAFRKGVNSFFLPSIYLEGGDNVNVTLVELLMMLTLLITFADYINRHK